jgi:predicted glycoside hydrolase/deacetylase ChbG (UPF0249 family)
VRAVREIGSKVKRLIINADDLGYDPEVSRGIVEAMERGVVSSTTMMVNGPHAEDAARRVRGKAWGIGLHVNLARWAPLSAPLRSSGEFVEARAAALTSEQVEAETLAQLDRLEALLGTPATHLDVHKHLHRHPGVLAGLLRAARARGLAVRAIDPAMREQVRAAGVRTPDHFVGDAGADPYWTLARLGAALAALEEGTTELMCHPGYAPSQVKSGYSAQREVELATFLSPEARAELSNSELVPVTFRD